MKDEEGVEFEDAECLTETDKAILCRAPDFDGDKVWIPKSQLVEGTEVGGKGDTGILIVSSWFCRKEGLGR